VSLLREERGDRPGFMESIGWILYIFTAGFILFIYGIMGAESDLSRTASLVMGAILMISMVYYLMRRGGAISQG